MRQIKRLLPVFLVVVIAVCMAFAVACAKKYTVTFDTDGGGVVASQTVTDGQKAEKPADPAKADYEFDGWFLGETKYDFETAVKSDVTLKAHWTRLYTVTYNSDGGSAVASQTVRDGAKVSKPANPTKANYTFAGWYNGTAEYKFTETVTGNLTLTAHWNINEYTVTFNTDGGSAVASVKVNHGGNVTQPEAPTKTGYTFAGWYNGETAYNFETAVTGNLTLTAHWTINEYTVTYNTDGGSEVASVKVNHGGKVTQPADPTKTGYTFDGWYVGETEYDFETAVTGNLTLTAHWTHLYTVTYNTDGGSAVASQTVKEGAKATQPEAPTKTGYTFAGWYNGETAYNFETAVTGNLTLTAHWTINEYTVTYNTDGGSEIESVKVNHGGKVTPPANPTKAHYTFDGWYVGETEYDFETAVTGNLTLTAHWELNKYTVTFDSKGGSEVEAAEVYYNYTVAKPEAPTNGNKILFGWYSDEEYEHFYDFNTKVTANVTLYAKWVELGENMLEKITINTENVKKAYTVGEELDTTGVVVTAQYRTQSSTTTSPVDSTDVIYDGSAYNKNSAGTYTVYVGFTYDGITRWASYDVTVTSAISGVLGIELEKTVTEYNVITEATPDVITVAINDLKVYSVNDNGTLGAEITEGISYKYYLGNKEIQPEDMTNQNARVYQIWAYVTHTSASGETYIMSDFVLVTILGDTIEEAELKSGTTVIAQTYTPDVSDWVITFTHKLTGAHDVAISGLEQGTGAGQYTIDNLYTAVIGGGEAKLTYYYAVGDETLSYEMTVPYAVTPATVGGTVSHLVDVKHSGDDYDKDNPAYDYQITSSLPDGAVIIPQMAYAYGELGLATNNENKADADNSNKLYGRVQLNSNSRGIKVYLAGPATLTFTARFGSSAGEGVKVVIKDATTFDQITETALISDTKIYVTVTATVEKAGVYVIFAEGGSLNLFRFGITTTVTPLQKSISANDATPTDGDKTENVTLSEDFTLVAKSGKAVNIATCDPITIGGMTFTKKIDLKGSGAKDNRHIAFTIPEGIEGKVYVTVYAGHGGGAAVERPLQLCKADGTAVATSQVAGAGTIVQFEITEAGSYYVRSSSSGQVIYYVGLSYNLAEVA